MVVSYRPGDWLVPCLTSVVEQADEVVLVDNGSEAFDATRFGEQAGARVLRLPSNTGFAPAVNLGVGACTGDVVGLLNDDATAGPDWLAIGRGIAPGCVGGGGRAQNRPLHPLPRGPVPRRGVACTWGRPAPGPPTPVGDRRRRGTSRRRRRARAVPGGG